MKKLLSIAAATAAFGFVAIQPASAQYTSSTVATQNTVVAAVVAPATATTVSSIVSGASGAALGGALGGAFAPSVVSAGNTATPVAGAARPLWSIGQTSLAAAAAARGIGVWAQGGYTRSENSFNAGSNNDMRFKGDIWVGLVGADYRINQRVLVGVAGGYQHVDINTTFNSGNYKQFGFGVNPYAAIALNQTFFIDVSGGYWWLDNESSRSSNAVKADYNSTRWSLGANLNAGHAVNNWRLLGQVGYIYTSSKSDAYFERGTGAVATQIAGATVNIGQGRVGGSVGYALGNVTPYAMARVEHNFTQPKITLNSGVGGQPKENRTGYRVGAGLRFNLSPAVSGDISGNYLLGKSDYKEYGGAGTIRVSF